MPSKASTPVDPSRQIRRNPRVPVNLISVAAAAERLGVSPTTIHRLRHELRYVRVNGQVRIDADALDAYVLRNTFGRGAI